MIDALFFTTLFCYASAGGFAEGVAVDDLGQLAAGASAVAERAGTLSEPACFAPPVCTFTRPDRARACDLHEGLTPSVESDVGPNRARTTLEHLLAPATIMERQAEQAGASRSCCRAETWRALIAAHPPSEASPARRRRLREPMETAHG
jgi:hypothetical protein